MNNSLDLHQQQIEMALSNILNEKLCKGVEHLSKLSAIDLLYFYGEIYNHFNVLLTVEDINNDCFSSLQKLSYAILKKKRGETNEKTH